MKNLKNAIVTLYCNYTIYDYTRLLKRFSKLVDYIEQNINETGNNIKKFKLKKKFINAILANNLNKNYILITKMSQKKWRLIKKK